jgi:5-methylcytosine-specific restriction endonuclease McrA
MNWRETREYRIWRYQVINRDKVCQCCGDIKDRVAHHLNHASYFPEQRFDPNNGVTLCLHCHVYFHTAFKQSNRMKCTDKDFQEYQLIAKFFMNRALGKDLPRIIIEE